MKVKDAVVALLILFAMIPIITEEIEKSSIADKIRHYIPTPFDKSPKEDSVSDHVLDHKEDVCEEASREYERNPSKQWAKQVKECKERGELE